jgi:hypothetical protein
MTQTTDESTEQRLHSLWNELASIPASTEELSQYPVTRNEYSPFINETLAFSAVKELSYMRQPIFKPMTIYKPQAGALYPYSRLRFFQLISK